MKKTSLTPKGRVEPSELQRQIGLFSQNSALKAVSNAVPNIVLVLNQAHQTVFINQRLVTELGLECATQAFGQRPGELFDCVHAHESADGCGTTEFCRTCGAVKAILNGLAGNADVQECSLTQSQGNEALDLRIYTNPLQVGGETFVFFAIADVSSEKRRQALEHIFFHDILNYAGGLHALIELLQMVENDQERVAVQNDLHRFSLELIDEINAQRRLVAAEKNELSLRVEAFDTLQILKDLVEIYHGHEVARGKHLKIDKASQEIVVKSDKLMLRRVVGNMTRNGLEASGIGDTVVLGCEQVDHQVRYWVHNSRPIPREIQLQIFNRSFSTKGSGRGLGTYSMKLLGEAYLRGRVSFTSDPDSGTTFQILLPIQANAP